MVQSDLLNGFCDALHTSMLNNHDMEIQICYICKHLTNKSFKIITMLYEFCKLKEENKQ